MTEEQKAEQEQKPDLSSQKLREKIRNLQQKLRRSKSKLDSMSKLISHLQEKLVINSEQRSLSVYVVRFILVRSHRIATSASRNT